MSRLRTLQADAEWKALKAEALSSREILLLKVSPICPISREAEREFDEWAAGLPESEGPILAKIDVIAARPLSRVIGQELGVKHESPQAIWLSADGRVRWHESHGGITAESLEQVRKTG